MTDLAPFGGQAATMTSREIADLVGSRHDKVKQSIERLAATQYNDDGSIKRQPVIDLPPMGEYLDPLNRPASEYVFRGEKGKRDSYVVVAQLCPEFTGRLVDRWQELEQQASRPLTAAEQLLASVQLTVDLERRQRQTEQQVAALAETVGDMDRSHPLLDSIPNGMESISAIRQRIGKQYGLPPRVIDAVVREMPHSPRPFAMVRSKHEELNARPFAVWAKAEISRVFERFARGCTFVTQHRATHPDFGAGRERFQMRGTPSQEIGE
ncbi:TPA: hypothetical protein ACSPWA_003638 [Pseudomonas aeruginosa]